jgi:hypothetical protein
VAWTAAAGAAPTATATPAAPLAPVGRRPDGARAATYALPVLDLTGGRTPSVTTLARTLDAGGNLVAAATGRPTTVQPSPTPAPKGEAQPGAAPAGFSILDRPAVIETASLTEASPVLVVVDGRVLYGVRPDPSWGLAADFVPLFAGGRVPYLVRSAQGPAGILVATDLAPEPPVVGGYAETRPATTAALVAASLLALGAGLAFVVVRRRRRRASG